MENTVVLYQKTRKNYSYKEVMTEGHNAAADWLFTNNLSLL